MLWDAQKTYRVRYYGNFSYSNGTISDQALKFVIPSKVQPASASGTAKNAVLGKIDVEISQAVNPRVEKRLSRKFMEVAPAHVAPGEGASKSVRSATGSHEIKKKIAETVTRHDKGDLLGRITLYYCATPGLVRMGVLASPNIVDPDDVKEDEKVKAEPKFKKEKTKPKAKKDTKRKRGSKSLKSALNVSQGELR